VETAIIAIQTLFLGICQWKNFENRLIFAEVMIKKQSGCFVWNTVHCSNRLVNATMFIAVSQSLSIHHIHSTPTPNCQLQSMIDNKQM